MLANIEIIAINNDASAALCIGGEEEVFTHVGTLRSIHSGSTAMPTLVNLDWSSAMAFRLPQTAITKRIYFIDITNHMNMCSAEFVNARHAIAPEHEVAKLIALRPYHSHNAPAVAAVACPSHSVRPARDCTDDASTHVISCAK